MRRLREGDRAMINRRLKQLFFAVLSLDVAPAAAPIARADVRGYLFQNFDQQPTLGSGSNASRPLRAANDNAGAAATAAANHSRARGRSPSRSTEMPLTPLS
jgi:hypothetical protein